MLLPRVIYFICDYQYTYGLQRSFIYIPIILFVHEMHYFKIPLCAVMFVVVSCRTFIAVFFIYIYFNFYLSWTKVYLMHSISRNNLYLILVLLNMYKAIKFFRNLRLCLRFLIYVPKNLNLLKLFLCISFFKCC